MAAKLITQAEFARTVGVTRGAIHLAARRDPPAVYIDPETRKIDPEHPLNITYKTDSQERNSQRQQAANLSKSLAKELSGGNLEGMLRGIIQNIASESATTKPESEEKSPPTSTPEMPSETHNAPPEPNANPDNNLKNYNPKIIQVAIQEKGQKAALANLKIQKEQLLVAELTGEMARRDHVETFIGIISGTISNYFLPLDFRLTATIMEICAVTDPKIKLEISEAIQKETTAGLAQVKKQVEEFALSLNPALS